MKNQDGEFLIKYLLRSILSTKRNGFNNALYHACKSFLISTIKCFTRTAFLQVLAGNLVSML
jgi:hypothetical protein